SASSALGSYSTSAASASGTLVVGTTATRLSVSASTWRATATMFLLLGSTTTESDAHASTASRIWAVDGFIDWPPATTRCTPRLVGGGGAASPTRTATTAVVTDWRFGALVVRSATTSASRTQRSSSTCSMRSVTRMLCGRPASIPASTAAP